MRFAFIAKHRSIWPVIWLCKALDVSRSGFHAWMNRTPAKRTLENEVIARVVRQSFIASDRTYGHGVFGMTFWPKASTAACTALSGWSRSTL